MQATFRYPKEFKTLPDYTAHAGCLVEILRPLTDDEVDNSAELERMFRIKAADGWEGDAFETELEGAGVQEHLLKLWDDREANREPPDDPVAWSGGFADNH